MRYSKELLYKVAYAFLQANGSDEYESKIVADHMVKANLRGHDSHGVGMIGMYTQYLKKGQIEKRPNPSQHASDTYQRQRRYFAIPG